MDGAAESVFFEIPCPWSDLASATRARLAFGSTAENSIEQQSDSSSARALPLPPEENQPEENQPREEFAALCEQIRAGSDPYFGEAAARELEARLQGPIHSLEARIGTRARLAGELRRLGRLDEAIDLFEESLELLGDTSAPALRRQLTRDLALAHLLRAEDDNCVAHHGAASCRLPVVPEAVHHQTEHTRRAGDLYAELARSDPRDATARWLLSLTRELSGEPETVPEPLRLPPGALDDAPFPRWTDIAPRLGVASYDLAGGAVMDDFDGDGLLDLISSTWDPCGSLKAFRNLGAGRFEDATRRWGLDAQLGGLHLVHADYDGDGMLDLLVLRGAWRGHLGEIRNSLLRNTLHEASSNFTDVTRAVGLDARRPTQTAAWADMDGDGDLDLYVGNEADTQNEYPSALYRNDGARFTEVGEASGVDNRRFAKGVAWGDYDDDGDPDLYVSNFGANRLYRNDGPARDNTVRFVDVAEELGVENPASSFATWFFDFDNDGDLDLFVADYGIPYAAVFASYLGYEVEGGRPALYRNDAGRFTEIGAEAGLTRPVLPMGSGWGDLDNDGWPDIYLGTGVPDLEAVMPNIMYRGSDRGFADVTSTGGFGHLQKGHAVAFGDFDGDGDQDLFQQMGGAYPVDAFHNALYENPGSDSEWIVLRSLRLGAQVRADVGAREIFATVGIQGSFSGSSLQVELGLGDTERLEELTIRRPGGSVRTFRGLKTKRSYRVGETVWAIPQGEDPAFRE